MIYFTNHHLLMNTEIVSNLLLKHTAMGGIVLTLFSHVGRHIYKINSWERN